MQDFNAEKVETALGVQSCKTPLAYHVHAKEPIRVQVVASTPNRNIKFDPAKGAPSGLIVHDLTKLLHPNLSTAEPVPGTLLQPSNLNFTINTDRVSAVYLAHSSKDAAGQTVYEINAAAPGLPEDHENRPITSLLSVHPCDTTHPGPSVPALGLVGPGHSSNIECDVHSFATENQFKRDTFVSSPDAREELAKPLTVGARVQTGASRKLTKMAVIPMSNTLAPYICKSHTTKVQNMSLNEDGHLVLPLTTAKDLQAELQTAVAQADKDDEAHHLSLIIAPVGQSVDIARGVHTMMIPATTLSAIATFHPEKTGHPGLSVDHTLHPDGMDGTPIKVEHSLCEEPGNAQLIEIGLAHHKNPFNFVAGKQSRSGGNLPSLYVGARVAAEQDEDSSGDDKSSSSAESSSEEEEEEEKPKKSKKHGKASKHDNQDDS